MQPVIRPATESDLPAINDIYNHYVYSSTCTYQEQPETLEARHAWFAHHDPARHPITVALREDQIVGWGSLSEFRDRSAYRFTVEDSVYIRHDMHRRGIGSAILADLIQRAKIIGFKTIIAGADAEQLASIAIHRKFGFEEVAHFRKVGFKFQRWLDVIFLQLWL
jgi:phosphinothricin acetyltransferase